MMPQVLTKNINSNLLNYVTMVLISVAYQQKERNGYKMCTNQTDNYSDLNVTRGDTLMLYGMTRRSYSIRLQIRLDQPVNPDMMRIAVDKTAERYPYFCVTLKKNDKEYLDAEGIRTLDMPITDKEIHDPSDDLPVIDMSSIKRPPSPAMINLMEASGLQLARKKGIIMKLMIPEESYISFSMLPDVEQS